MSNTLQDAEGIVSYGNDEEALQAAETGCCIVDQSGWGRLRVSGPDKLKFLHGQVRVCHGQCFVNLSTAWHTRPDSVVLAPVQTTQDMLARLPGSGCLTVSSKCCLMWGLLDDALC